MRAAPVVWTLAGVLVGLNVLLPTALPLWFDGLPWSTAPELGLLDLLILALVLLPVSAVLIRGELLARPRPSARCVRVGTTVASLLALSCVLLLGIRLANPASAEFQTCVSIPGAPQTQPCLFSADNPFHYDRGALTRFDRTLTFGGLANPWRIGELNGLQPFGGAAPQLAALREKNSLPMRMQIRVPTDLLERLGLNQAGVALDVDYIGQVSIGPDGAPGEVQNLRYSGDGRHQQVQFERGLSSLSLTYSNFACDAGRDDASCIGGSEFTPISLDAAHFSVAQVDATGALHPLTYRAPAGPAGIDAAKVARALELGAFGLCLLLFAVPLVPIALRVGRGIRTAAPGWRSGQMLRAGAGIALAAVVLAGMNVLSSSLFCAGIILSAPCDQRYSVLLTAVAVPVALVLVSPAIRLAAGRALTAIGPAGALLLLVAPLVLLSVWLVKAQDPIDSVQLYTVGNDQLTYAAWARTMLREKSFEIPDPTLVSTTILSKPLFPYWRTAFYLLEGDGTYYYSEAMRFLLLSIPLVLLYLLFIASTRQLPRLTATRTIQALIASATVVVCCAFVGLSFDNYVSLYLPAMSEAPAWALTLLAASLCVSLAAVHRRPGWILGIIGLVLACGIALRTTSIAILPPLLATSWLLLRDPRERWRLALLCWPLLPGALVLGGFWLQDRTTYEWYLDVNSSVGKYDSGLSLTLAEWPKLIVNWQYLSIVGLFVAVVLAGVFLGPAQHRRRRWLVLLALLAFVAGFCFLVEIPLLGGPYYPRMIALSYYAVAVLAAILALTWFVEAAPRSGSTVARE